MVTTRIFVCHDVNEHAQRDAQILHHLRNRLQESGAEVIIYPGRPADEGFLPFLNQQLPTCQWFIMFQTPAVLQAPPVRMAVDAALKLVEQKHMQGLLRFISTPGEPQGLPPEWSTIKTFDGTYDYPRAIEKLLLAFSSDASDAGTTLLAPPPLSYRSNITPSPTYDRPPLAPSRMSAFKIPLQNTLYDRRKLMIVLTVLLLITLMASLLGFFALRRPPTTAKANPGIQIYGHVFFYSTGYTGATDITGNSDGISVYLQNLRPPASGNVYYAWLLPDTSVFSGIKLAGTFTPVNGNMHFTYQTPDHSNLLATDSRFLITEEAVSPPPDSPTADQSKWRYYAAIPQVPNPHDPSHFSDLSHLRHLLVGDPMMDKSLQGGLDIWFFQNVRKILEWATAARGTGTPQNAPLMHNHFIRILDYLDGTDLVHLDVPPGSPVLVDPNIAHKPLLTLDPTAMEQGYIHEIELHLLALSGSPFSSSAQRTLAGKIDVALNRIKVRLDHVRQDARKLVGMTDKRLLDPATLPLLDDLVNQATIAFAGQVDPSTGSRLGGATWIFDHMEQLAQLDVTKYVAPA